MGLESKAFGHVREAGLPLALFVASSTRPDAVLAQVAQGHRMGTMRKRVRKWERARRFPLTAYGAPLPTEVAQLLNYIGFWSSPAGRGRQ